MSCTVHNVEKAYTNLCEGCHGTGCHECDGTGYYDPCPQCGLVDEDFDCGCPCCCHECDCCDGD